MSSKEKTAIAILKSGGSFKDASDVTGIPARDLIQLWSSIKSAANGDRIASERMNGN